MGEDVIADDMALLQTSPAQTLPDGALDGETPTPVPVQKMGQDSFYGKLNALEMVDNVPEEWLVDLIDSAHRSVYRYLIKVIDLTDREPHIGERVRPVLQDVRAHIREMINEVVTNVLLQVSPLAVPSMTMRELRERTCNAAREVFVDKFRRFSGVKPTTV